MRSRYPVRSLAVLIAVCFIASSASAIDKAPESARTKHLLDGTISDPQFRSGDQGSGLDGRAMELSMTLADMTLWQGLAGALVSGNRAYYWLYYGLQVVDISDPANPVILHELRHPVHEVEMRLVGNILYTLDPATGVMVIDVSSSPVLLQILPPVGTSYASGMDIEGTHLFVTCQSVISSHSGLQIYDITDPAAPQFVSFENVPMLPNRVDVVGDHAYIVDEWNLNVVSVSDLNSPQWLSKVSCSGDAWDLEVSGDYAFVSNRGDSSLIVVNIANSMAPYVATELILDTTWFWPTTIRLLDHYAYVQDGFEFKIVDVATPLTPTVAATWSTVKLAQDLVIDGNVGYIPSWSFGLYEYDLSSPLAPVETWHSEIPGMGYDVELVGNYAIEANGIKGIQVIDVSDPDNLQVVGSHDTPGEAMGIAVRDNYALVADSSIGLIVFDISSPTAPVIAGSCETPGQPGRIAIYDQYAYLIARDSGITVVNISDPASPVIVNQIFEPGLLYHYLTDHRLCVSSFQNKVSIYDLTVPQSPSLITTFDPNQSWNAGIALRGDYLFVAEDTVRIGRFGSLCVYNISDPLNPVPVAEVDTVDFTREMVIVDNHLYLADCTLGVQVFDISNPEAPYRIGHYDANPGWAWGIAIRDGVVYVAADNGFLTLHLGDCAGPDGNGQYNISDVVFLITYIFGTGPAPIPLRAGDVNCDGQVNVSDAVYLVNYIFTGGPAPCGGC